MRNAVEKISGDLCISRPKSRLDWGIELPFDKDFVTYVWFDALINYISFAGYDPTVATGLRPVHASHSNAATTFDAQPREFRDKWPALQIIGKDILIPAHGIYWLIMLHALGFPDDQMPQLLVHGWWNLSGAKISKSAGNVVDPNALADKYGAEALRFYLMIDIGMGKDADFLEERLVSFYNTSLANGIGNLLSRSLNMVHKYLGGKLKEASSEHQSEIKAWFLGNVSAYKKEFDGDEHITREGKRFPFPPFQTSEAAKLVMLGASVADQVIEQHAPWKLAKDPSQARRLESILYECAEALRIIAILISPVLPKAAHGIFDQLNWKMELSGKEERFHLDDAKWGGLPDGHVVGKPVPLFPRIETT